MARQPEELVEMRRALGAQLAVFRQAAELTHQYRCGEIDLANTGTETVLTTIGA